MQPTGLTTQEAQAQFRKFGPNEIVKAKKLSVFLDFLQRFRNPLLLILIFGAIASGVLGDPITAAIIIVIVIASVLVDFINTYRSQKAADDLKKRVMLTTTVLRDGKECELPFAQLVPNDVVVLHPGDIIPADGVVSDLRDLYVNESQLTGESFPVEKQEGTQVFMGSNVTTGKAFLTVQQTGRDTKFSHIAESLIKRDVLTEFDRGLLEFSVLIMKLTLILVAAIFLVDTILKQNLLESLLFSIALAIGLTPELLPMIIAVNLSKGSLAMAKQGVIVKKLSAIQNFGNMDILCTDKTGTLTQDTIQVVRYVDENGGNSDSVLLAAYVNSEFSTGFRSPLDAAIKAFKNLDISAYTRIDEIPFDFDRRRDSVIVELNNEHVLIAKGAPEQVIQACITYGGSAELTADAHAKIIAEYESLSKDGFRVLGVAKKHMPNSKQAYVTSDEQDMTFLGFIAFFDPPKESVSKTLQMLEKYGVEIKVLTGDNDLVTKKVCDEIALPIKGILLGSEIEHLTDDQLKTQAEQTTIFARVSPDQKERIIRILRENGHVVGYLGDGINDAPPLKAADVGISVNNAVDVAKDTADLILLEKSLENLIAGVIEGRRIFANTMKYLMMGLSSNFGNMFSMAGASVLLPFLPMTAPQILLNNLLYDSSQLAIPTDNVDDSYLMKPSRFKIHFIYRFMAVFGPLSSIFDFLTFFVLAGVFQLTYSAFQTGWFLESIITQTFVVYIIRTRKIPFLQSRPSVALIASTTIAVAIAWIIPFSPIGVWFHLVPLAQTPIIAILCITTTYLLLTEIVKRWFYRKFFLGDKSFG